VPLHPIQPRYTEVARRTGTQGTVIVEAIIDEKGNATNVRILRGLPMGLDQAAMEAIQQTRFKPAMMGSRPVKVYFTLTVNFTIQR
jgi:protein TonB